MSASKFKFIALEIPDNIDFQKIDEMKKRIASIDFEKARIINNFINLSIDDVDISEELTEDDLFHIGEDALKIKKAVHDFLHESIDVVLAPRIMINSRLGTDINENGFAYLELENKIYAVSGEQTAYYSGSKNKAYSYLLSLSMAGIINL